MIIEIEPTIDINTSYKKYQKSNHSNHSNQQEYEKHENMSLWMHKTLDGSIFYEDEYY